MLPIPNILQNASNAIDAAKKVSESPTSPNMMALTEALKLVSPDDLLAVMNEVGRVYMGIQNLQIMSFGSAPHPEPSKRMVNLAVIVNFGMGPATFVASMPIENAEKLADQIRQDSDTVRTMNGEQKKLLMK